MHRLLTTPLRLARVGTEVGGKIPTSIYLSPLSSGEGFALLYDSLRREQDRDVMFV